MKFSLASTLPIAALALAKSAAATQDIHEYTTFDIAGVAGEMASAEKAFFETMLVDTYNLVHSHEEGPQTEATSFAVESQQSERRALRGETTDESVHRMLPGRNWGGGVYGGNCFLCYGGRKLAEGEERELQDAIPGDSTELHRRFELTFAAVLREGPYSYFHDVSDVVIDFGATQN